MESFIELAYFQKGKIAIKVSACSQRFNLDRIICSIFQMCVRVFFKKILVAKVRHFVTVG